MLFMPASRADMIAKIPRLAPDVAVVDLEDAVPADAKDAARDVAAAAVGALDPAGRRTVLIRVNPVGTPWFADDVADDGGLRRGRPGRPEAGEPAPAGPGRGR